MARVFNGRDNFSNSTSMKQCNIYTTPGSLGYWIRYEVKDLILSPLQWGYGVVTVEICDPALGVIVSSKVKVQFLAGQMGLPLKKISNVLSGGKVGGKHDFPEIESGSKSLWNRWASNGTGAQLPNFDIRKISLKRLSILLPKLGTTMERHFVLVARDNKNRKIVYNNSKHLSRYRGWDIWNVDLTFGRIAYKSDGAFSRVRSRKGNCFKNRHGDVPSRFI